MAAVDTPPAPRSNPPPTISRKHLVLSLLIVQNASIALLTRWSRLPSTSTSTSGSPSSGSQPPKLFIPSTAVFVAEVIKGIISFSVVVTETRRRSLKKFEEGGVNGREGDEKRVVAEKVRDAERRRGKEGRWLINARRAFVEVIWYRRGQLISLSIPSALYAAQNNLLYIGLSNLDAAPYQLVYQLKILSTALFSVFLFRKPNLSSLKWLSLVLLAVGVAIVQLDAERGGGGGGGGGKDKGRRDKVEGDGEQDRLKGFAAVAAASLSSGLAGCWFERALTTSTKDYRTPSQRNENDPQTLSRPSLWTLNTLLCLPSLLFSLLALAMNPSQLSLVLRYGLLQNYTVLTWVVILNQALGGLLVAMVVKEAGTVEKGFATSLSIILSTLMSSYLFSFVPGSLFLLGATLVIGSTVIFATAR